ncbi:hypothetical protein Ciccas_009671 [Cichlidogyrus casuarinus]|uniref:Uncharacterized protein n=1 Tax=Cichlidogyrus casuarinus TaxID=1844966 RepID=A0ABD2PWD9_9PLAT
MLNRVSYSALGSLHQNHAATSDEDSETGYVGPREDVLGQLNAKAIARLGLDPPGSLCLTGLTGNSIPSLANTLTFSNPNADSNKLNGKE